MQSLACRLSRWFDGPDSAAVRACSSVSAGPARPPNLLHPGDVPRRFALLADGRAPGGAGAWPGPCRCKLLTCSALYPSGDAASLAAGVRKRCCMCRLAPLGWAALHWRCPGNPGARAWQPETQAQQPRRISVRGFLLRSAFRFNGGACGEGRKPLPVPVSGLPTPHVLPPMLGSLGGRF